MDLADLIEREQIKTLESLSKAIEDLSLVQEVGCTRPRNWMEKEDEARKEPAELRFLKRFLKIRWPRRHYSIEAYLEV